MEQTSDSEQSPFVTPRDAEIIGKSRRKGRLLCGLIVVSLIVVLVATVFSVGLAVGHFVFGQSGTRSSNVASTGSSQDQSQGFVKSSVAAGVCTKPPLLLISLDGFRQEYLNRSLSLYLNQIALKGVKADFLSPAFPSKTFPNHYTIVTGLYPESHGIVGNNFYDKTLKASFALGSSTQNDPKWWFGEPIWVTAAKQGLKSGIYFWPGSEVPIQGVLPTFYFKYNSGTSFSQQVSTVLGWLDLSDDQRPQVMVIYFNEPDGEGHSYGPDSSQVNAAIGNIDAVIESLFVGLEQRGIEDCVNVMIVSDHGMTKLDKTKTIYISDYLPSQYSSGVTYPSYGVNAEINFFNQESVTTAVTAINQAAVDRGASFKAYLRENIPPRFHLGTVNGQRVGDIYLIGDLGSYIYPTKNYNPTSYVGNHGYDNELPDMQSIFVAHGPAFKQGYQQAGFNNIELYNLMCELLGIVPSPNNGTIGALRNMLKT